MLASLLWITAIAQNYRPFPGETVDQRTRNMQERVEAIYAAADLQRALLIYEKDLAPLGDKYAQYMVGYMHLYGEGVNPGPGEVLAWFRLAAEWGEPLLEHIRDEVRQQLSADEVLASNEVYLALWKSIGDHALIMELIQEDMNVLLAQTGTGFPGAGNTSSSFAY